MSDRIKVRKIGNSLGVVIPADALSRHKVSAGDELLLTLTPNGYSLAVYDQEVADQVKAGRDIAKKYKNTLRELAK
ncbi:MAG: AbrB/MazE/SpoVT family DNA-binding domain-containing protein [Henriciella sp.]|nr:AbrB/MazE/SpoVT family DNA-binding domain-containing protein [Henriciella sp.]